MKKQKNLTLAVYSRIKDMMLNYEIVPGQRLVFVDLAEQLGVSRTPVNNALSILAKEGYLDFVPNQGYSVHRLTLEEAEALYEIREILEVGTIGKAIRQMGDEELATFKQRKQDYENAITDRVHRKLFILDTEFHAGMIEMTGNAILAGRYRDICQKIFLRFRTEDLRVERIEKIVEEHEQIYEAVRIKDVARTKELLKTHNDKARKNLFSIIFQREQISGKLKNIEPSEAESMLVSD
ncbi:MAG: GntR family transcriptional regulator [Desulfobacteraceae bacterium]